MRTTAACLPLIGFAVIASAAPLQPMRQSVSKPPYRIDFVDDREEQPRPGQVRILVRVSDATKKPTKPSSIHLTTGDKQVVKATRRKDESVSKNDSSGLPPLTVTPRVNSYGGGGLGIGINLNSLMGGAGEYSYTKVDFPESAFVRGSTLQIGLRDGKSLSIPATQFAR